MTERPTEFAYHNIELFKSESLGSGSYGGVCKAKCDGLLCAAKIMHPTLFDLRDPGTASYLRKFREECHLLSLARHPNVVQYLGTYTDPDTQLPVLLMELCDESLTSFLERSSGPLSYHIQVNISHDIALALVYLHSNGLIHRDLTGNNVLMIAGTRAKITDFGMSKLATVNPRMTALTLCPGNVLYMSPEALDEAKSYTAKLDVFSFGVIVIQILTRQFPNPTDRFQFVSVPQFEEQVRVLVPDLERRAAHLQLIPDTHSLKPLALQCLKQKESVRPSALQLSGKLSELKESSQYTDSVRLAESSDRVEQPELELPGHKILTESKSREAVEHQEQISGLESIIQDKDRELQARNEQIEAKDGQLQAKDGQLQAKDGQIQAKERELQGIQQALQHAIASRDEAEQLVSEFQRSLQQKDKTIADLQQTISEHERKIQQLEQQDTASRPDLPLQQSVATPQKTEPAAQKDISNMKWRKGKNAPVVMGSVGGAAVVCGHMAYFTNGYSRTVYSCKIILGEEEWSQLPISSYKNFGLSVINGFLTSVGGRGNDYTNTLLSLTGEGERKQWSEIFPPMPTPRSHVACVSTERTLIVAGGKKKLVELGTVEVMNINTRQWMEVTSLPHRSQFLSVTSIGKKLYIAEYGDSVFTCSIPDLLSSATTGSSPVPNVWKNISALPVTRSTLVSFGGHLLAIGGNMDIDKPTSNVYRYEFNTDSWTVASQLKKKRSDCLAVALGDSVVVVGGWSSKLFRSETDQTDSVEILK